MKKGSHHTEESKRKISEANKGRITWNLGVPCSEEVKRKLSEANKGQRAWNRGKKKQTNTGRTHFKKGHIPWNKGKTLSKEYRMKLSESHKGQKISDEHRRKISEANKGRVVSEETRRKISESLMGHVGYNLGKKFSEEHKRKISEAHKGKQVSEETRRRISIAVTKMWTDPEYRDMMVKKIVAGSIKKPNRPEQFLIDLFEEHGLPFKYVGAGDFILGGKNPDFLNYNGRKQIIELYGDYWHAGDAPQERIDFFRGFGFDTLVIWEHELSDPGAVLGRVESFGVV